MPSTVPMPNLRPLGRPTITKVPSPHAGHSAEPEKQKSVAEAVQRNVGNAEDQIFYKDESSDENAEVVEDSSFNWYFQHYNDSNLEPYVGTAYSGGEEISVCRWTLLAQVYLIFYAFI